MSLLSDIVDDEMMELVELEVHELLEEFGSPADSPIIHGSAKLALDGDTEELLRLLCVRRVREPSYNDGV